MSGGYMGKLLRVHNIMEKVINVFGKIQLYY
jgi:hypothetical protein